MDRNEIARNLKTFGMLKTFQDLGLRALNRVLLLKILKGVAISKPDPNFTRCAENYRGLFLDRSMLMKFAADPQNELTEKFVREAFARGDECYGFLCGDSLASYGWYSREPTPIHPPELMLHFGDGYVYMYKGFTHVSHRGQRLHSVGMTRALETYLAKGYKGLVSYVEWNNFGSLRSCYRMGYLDFGAIVIVRLFGRYFAHSSAGCELYGFRLEWTGTEISRRGAGGKARATANL
jgi:hypothetical protein